MKVIYFLYRKGDAGTVTNMGGIELSEGCFLIPSNAADKITQTLNSFGV